MGVHDAAEGWQLQTELLRMRHIERRGWRPVNFGDLTHFRSVWLEVFFIGAEAGVGYLFLMASLTERGT